MSIVQSGDDPSCKHGETTPWEKGAFALVPVFTANCLRCGEFLFKFPSSDEVSSKEMDNAFDQSHKLLRGEPTD